MAYRFSTDTAIAPLAWAVGQRVPLDDGHEWTVQAITPNFAALTRTVTQRDRDNAQAEVDEHEEDSVYREFAERRRDQLNEAPVFYTVVDWRNGVRGPCNLIGQSWGDGSYSEGECAKMLAEFEAGDLEVSHRNWVSVRVRDGRLV